MKKTLISLAVLNAITGSAYAADFGQKVEHLLNAQSVKYFGVVKPLDASSSASISADEANADPRKLMTVAHGLHIKVISSRADLGPNVDQMVLWPDNVNPTHIIACNEQSTGQVALQRIDIETGAPANIIDSGLKSCDPVRITSWGLSSSVKKPVSMVAFSKLSIRCTQPTSLSLVPTLQLPHPALMWRFARHLVWYPSKVLQCIQTA